MAMIALTRTDKLAAKVKVQEIFSAWAKKGEDENLRVFAKNAGAKEHGQRPTFARHAVRSFSSVCHAGGRADKP